MWKSSGCVRQRLGPTKTRLQDRIEQTEEFWDLFEASIHRNPNLLPADKFNYSRAELEGDASAVTSGLELTNSNCEVAVNVLQERFGRD